MTESRTMVSQTLKGWKQPSRPTPAQPTEPAAHVPQCHIPTALGHLQVTPPLPGQLWQCRITSGEGTVPNSQPEPPLAQREAIPSRPTAVPWEQRPTPPHTASFRVVAGSHEDEFPIFLFPWRKGLSNVKQLLVRECGALQFFSFLFLIF